MSIWWGTTWHLGKPITQLVVADMSGYNSKKQASHKWVAVFQAEKYVNSEPIITSGQLKDQVFGKCCLNFY